MEQAPPGHSQVATILLNITWTAIYSPPVYLDFVSFTVLLLFMLLILKLVLLFSALELHLVYEILALYQV